MPFEAREMFFYEDGLSHETTLMTSDDSDACYAELVDLMKKKMVFFGRVVEVDANGKFVWEDHPYPRVKEPEAPQFFYDYMRSEFK